MALVLTPEDARELDRLAARIERFERDMRQALAKGLYQDVGLYGADGRKLLTPGIQGLAAWLR